VDRSWCVGLGHPKSSSPWLDVGRDRQEPRTPWDPDPKTHSGPTVHGPITSQTHRPRDPLGHAPNGSWDQDQDPIGSPDPWVPVGPAAGCGRALVGGHPKGSDSDQ
jgi:hypothetical protein